MLDKINELKLPLFLCMLSSACAIVVSNPPNNVNGVTDYIFSAQLSTPIITRKTHATVAIECGGGTESAWAVSSTAPAADSGLWTSCSEESFEAQVELEEGDNTVTLWFRDPFGNVNNTPAELGAIARAESIELIDPTPGNNQGGSTMCLSPENVCETLFSGNPILLSNRTWVAGDPHDSSIASKSGAIHFYTLAGDFITSLKGEEANDRFGGRIFELSNGNIVVVSSYDTVNGVEEAGSTKVIDTNTHEVLFTFYGNDEHDFFGNMGIVELTNGNIAIISSRDDVGGIVDAGSVRVYSLEDGTELYAIVGDNAGDTLGYPLVKLSTHGDLVITSNADDVGGVVDAGSVIIINYLTGVERFRIVGDNTGDAIQQIAWPTTNLADGSLVVGSRLDDVDGIVDAGSVKVIHPLTGAVIFSLAGEETNDQIGSSGVRQLTNGNVVVLSANDDVDGVVGAGSVRVYETTSWTELFRFVGDENDMVGSITELSNGNLLVSTRNDDVGGVVNSGSVRVFNGSTGAPIFTVSGDNENDYLSNAKELTNGNILISSGNVRNGAVLNAGMTMMVNATGTELFRVYGDSTNDQLQPSSSAELSNGDIFLTCQNDDINGLTDAGSARVIDGQTGVQKFIKSGNLAGDRLGNIAELSGGRYVIYSPQVEVSGNSSAGWFGVVNANTEVVEQSWSGASQADYFGGWFTSLFQDILMVKSTSYDNHGFTNSGQILILALD